MVAPFQTREQRDLERAYVDISQVDQEKEKTQRIYGGLCHKVPILVLTDGLAQTVAFLHEKAADGEGATSKARPRAHYLLACHLAALLDLPTPGPGALLERVRGAAVPEYVACTRAILHAAVFYKRFAVSVLNVEPGQDEEEDE